MISTRFGIMSEVTAYCQSQLNLFRRQYFQLQADIKYPDSKCLRQDTFQKTLYEEVFNENATAYHPPQRYQIRVLKELTKRIEASITNWEEEGISDDLMSRLSSLFALPMPSEAVNAQQRSYVTYTISNLSLNSLSPTITLLEAKSILGASGTTGFRTWEACLHLGVYLSSHGCKIPVAYRNVLELGAGTGYLSILCAKYLNAAHVTVTDGSKTLVADLATNFYLNGLQESPLVEAKELKWGHTLGQQVQWIQGRQIDIVLGADVTYDSVGIPALIATMADLVELFPSVEILIAATIRNETTFETFLEGCGRNGLVVNDILFPVIPAERQEGPFYGDGLSIKLCHIWKE